MAWIGLTCGDEALFCPRGLDDAGKVPAPRADSLAARGAFVLEAKLTPESRPHCLLSHRRPPPWRSGLSLNTLPGGGVALVMTQGEDVIHATVPGQLPAQGEVLRITYAWDAPARQGRLSIEHPQSGFTRLTGVAKPKPLPLSDLGLITRGMHAGRGSSDTELFAVSSAPEPIGPMPTLACDAPIATPEGYRPAGSLRRGDLVRGIDGQLHPVLGLVRRTVPASGGFAPVRLRAPYFGLHSDVVVAPDQRLVIEGSDVEYTFGHERVLVPARHLVNGTAALREPCGTTITYVQPLLPDYGALIVAGTPMESLFLGRLRRKPALLAASLLCDYPRVSLPEHMQTGYRVLRPYEAITLAAQRAA